MTEPKKRTYVSPTEKAIRIELCESMLARGVRVSQIKRLFQEKYGLSTKSVNSHYIAQARKNILARLAEPKEYHRGGALEFLQAVKNDPKATVRDKVHAQREINKLLGLHQPTRVDITTDGKEIKGYVGFNPDDERI